MIDLANAYLEVQDRLCQVLTGLDDARAATPVPACPGWSVRDVIAHLDGGVVDIVSGNAPELAGGVNFLEQWRDENVARARDALTGREVAERAGRSLPSLAHEWQQATISAVPMMRGKVPFPNGLVSSMISGILMNDVVVHETDIRSALGLGRAPDGAALSLALSGYGFSLDYRIRALGLAPLIFEYDGKQRRFGGEGEPAATLRAGRFDLVRILAARRTADEIRTYDWTGNPEPYIDILPEYGPVPTSTGD